MVSTPMFGSNQNGIGNLGSLSGNGTSVGHNLLQIAGFSQMAQDLYRAQTQAYDDSINSGASAANIQKPVMEKAIGSSEEYNTKLQRYLLSLPQQNNLSDALKSLQTQAINAGIKNVPPIPDIPKSANFDNNQANAILSDYSKKVNQAGTVEYFNVDSSLSSIRDSFIKSGGKASDLPLPPSYNQGVTSQSQAQQIVDSYLAKANTILGKTVQTSTTTTEYYDVDTAMQKMIGDAIQYGYKPGSVALPNPYGNTVTDKAQADKIISDFTTKLQSSLPPVFSPQNTVNEVYQNLVNSGYGNITKPPTVSDTTDSAAAKKAVDDYVSTLNKSNLLDPAANLYNLILNGAPQSQINQVAQQAGYKTNIDPSKSGGSFVVPLDPSLVNRYFKALSASPYQTLTEYQFRQQIGENTFVNPSGTYHVLTGSDKVMEGSTSTANHSALSNPAVAAIVSQNDAISKVLGASANSYIVSDLAKTTATPKVISGSGLVPSAVKDITKITSPEAIKSLSTLGAARALDTVNDILKISENQPISQQLNTLQSLESLEKSVGIRKISTDNEAVSKILAEHEHLTNSQIIAANSKWNQVSLSAENNGPSNASVITPLTKAQMDKSLADVNEALRLASEATPLMDKYGNAIQQVTGKGANIGVNENGQNVLIETPVEVTQNGIKYYVRDASIIDAQSDNFNGAKYAAQFASVIPGAVDLSKGYKASSLPSVTSEQLEKADFDLKNPAYEDALKKGGVFAISAQLDKATKEALSFANVTKAVTGALEGADKYVSGYVQKVMPKIDDKFIEQRNAAFTKVGLEGARESVQNAVYNSGKIPIVNISGKDVMDWGNANVIEGMRLAPVSAALNFAVMYVGGEVAGAAVEGGIGLAESTLGKAALTNLAKASAIGETIPKVLKIADASAGSVESDLALGASEQAAYKIANPAFKYELAGNAANTLAKGIRPVAQLGLTGGLILDGKSAITSGDPERVLNFAGNLAIGGLGYQRGVETVRGKSLAEIPNALLESHVPGLESVDLKEVPNGATARVNNIPVGKTISVLGKDIISKDSTGLHLGTSEISEDSLKGYGNIKPYSKAGTRAFDKFVQSQMSELDKVFNFAGRDITDTAYNAKSPIVNPSKFEIMSKHIPESARAPLTEAIKSYGGGKVQGLKDVLNGKTGGPDYKIQVYGSGAQKLFMGDFQTRVPKDLEVSVNNTTDFIQKFVAKADKSGMKEGKDYRVTGEEKVLSAHNSDSLNKYSAPKIEFKMDGKWVKGVEVFSHVAGSDKGALDFDDAGKEEVGKALSFTYESLKSAKVDGIKLNKLQEQGARKYSGSTNLKIGEIEGTPGKGTLTLEPSHGGRIKDVGQLVEIGVGYKLVKNLGDIDTIISYAKAGATKFPSLVDEKADEFSPVVKYLNENGKLPTAEEIKGMKGKEETGRELLYSNEGKGNIIKALEFAKETFKEVPRSSISGNSVSTGLKSIESSLNDLDSLSKRVEINDTVSRDVSSSRQISEFSRSSIAAVLGVASAYSPSSRSSKVVDNTNPFPSSSAKRDSSKSNWYSQSKGGSSKPSINSSRSVGSKSPSIPSVSVSSKSSSGSNSIPSVSPSQSSNSPSLSSQLSSISRTLPSIASIIGSSKPSDGGYTPTPKRKTPPSVSTQKKMEAEIKKQIALVKSTRLIVNRLGTLI